MATITCGRCGGEVESMQNAPMGGRLGEDIQRSVCTTCWSEWLGQQMLMINHYGLQMGDPEDRKKLIGVMREYLNLEPA